MDLLWIFSDSPLVLVDEFPNLTVLLLNASALLKNFLFQTFVFLKTEFQSQYTKHVMR